MPATAVTQFLAGLLLLMTCVASAWSETLTITFDGVSTDLQDHILPYLTIASERDRTEQMAGRLKRLHNQAPEQIKTALQVYGFYRAKVAGQLNTTIDGWEAIYKIDLGEPIPIGNVDLQIDGAAADDEVIQKWLAQQPLQAGKPFEHPVYDQTRDDLLRLVVERGYLDAVMVRHEVYVDVQRYVADIVLHLNSGNRFYFGQVHFTDSDMDQKLLQRFVKFKPGDPYLPGELLKLQTSLSGSGYFQSVEVRPDRKAVDGEQIPIDVNLESRLPRQWRFGLGYATDTGARISANHTRLLNSEGDKFLGELLLSEKLRQVSGAYLIPLQDPVNEQLGIGARYTNEITESRNSHITGANINYTSIWRDWQRSFGLNLERETYSVGDSPEQTQQVLYPSIRLYRVKSDDRLRPRHGYRMQVEVRGAREEAFSDTNFAQLRSGMKWVGTMGENGRVLVRGDFGTSGVSDLEKLPASQRFFAGGDNSVRGYAYEELGPKNDSGEVVGGKHLIVGSVELEHKLAGNWSAATFYDVGNAIDSLRDDLMSGAGVGLRWNSPVGPVRFDFAWALDKETDRFRLHVVFGPDL